ncbi:MAG: hypothetical protein GTO51_00955, partial [Candidatus Latescibacteria bacterium]|nr:hypothetical protein [Candidatus Latescibacterota bacterium]NIM64549.1 hypothetical protein [Candidatus Latescibacterota bacterium]NIO01063.1 hypothetical protein [Candidatus Latescibacterota bacterium]NIT02562.1 hypothetical protein [Candidatus Latescibacterota bacterium]NIT37990.1 hypothetical protein [Candidatus Latescibacterota bacterium]
AGLKQKLFLPQLAMDKEETLNWIQEGRLKTPTLLIWSYNDPTASIPRGLALFDLVVGSAPNSQMHIFNRSGHFCYREHPQAFNDVVRAFVESI